DVPTGRSRHDAMRALRVRSVESVQSRQGLPHAASVRRGSGPVPRASDGTCRRRRAVLMQRSAPASAEEAASVMMAAASGRTTVVVQGGGTKAEWGPPARPADVILSTARLNRVVAHRFGDLTATVEAGATLAATNRHLARHGQWIALDSPFSAHTRLGG